METIPLAYVVEKNRPVLTEESLHILQETLLLKVYKKEYAATIKRLDWARMVTKQLLSKVNINVHCHEFNDKKNNIMFAFIKSAYFNDYCFNYNIS